VNTTSNSSWFIAASSERAYTSGIAVLKACWEAIESGEREPALSRIIDEAMATQETAVET